MVELKIGPAFSDFAKFTTEDQIKDIFRKFLFQKKLILLRSFFIIFLFIIVATQAVQAHHKCPKVPAPPGLMGVFSSSSLLPSGSTMAVARSSETSGCEHGHPSENFYKPKNKQIALFLKHNFLQLKLESAQGQGQHLDVLANLAGCNMGHDDFVKLIRNNYVQVFNDELVHLDSELSTVRAVQARERLLNLMSNSPLLATSCESS